MTDEERFPLRRSKPCLSKCDPACSELHGACCEHEVQRAVFDDPWGLRNGRYDHERRRLIENIEIRIVQYLLKMM